LKLLRLSSQLTSSVKQTILYTHKEKGIYENEDDKEKEREREREREREKVRDKVYTRAKREIRAIASAHNNLIRPLSPVVVIIIFFFILIN
jgi:Skp family chaperone for outer membrane proteins